MAVDIGVFVVQGAIISASYALVALGFTMIFGVGGVLNLAHGALVMAGAYAYLALSRDLVFESIVVHPYLAAVGAILIAGVGAFALYFGLVRFIEENPVTTFLATLLFAVLFQEVVTAYVDVASPTVTLVGGLFEVPGIGVELSNEQVAMFVVSWIAIGLLWYYVTKTDSGRAIRATAMSERGARLAGVNLAAVQRRTWLIAGGLAGLAGIFLSATGHQPIGPAMWLTPLTLAFIIVVVGGIGSIKGSIIAAYVIGYMEWGAITFLNPDFQGVFSLAVLIAVLLVRPQGLFGRELVHE